MGIASTVREYAKLSRSFNAALTGVAPVLGAVSVGVSELNHLIALFVIGFLGHIYGFVLNDYIDVDVDRLSKGLTDRPLVSGTISKRRALIFAFASMLIAFGIALYFFNLWAFSVLLLSAVLVTIYDVISKRFPGTDIILAFSVLFLILFGAFSAESGSAFESLKGLRVTQFPSVSGLALVILLLGFFQVLFMNIVAGGLKDIDHDYLADANTLAVKLGVKADKSLHISNAFKVLAHSIELAFITLVFIPFLIFNFFKSEWQIFQVLLLVALSIFMLFISTKLLGMKKFERDELRKYIGIHYSINYSLAPILLIAVNPYTILLVFLPPLGFMLSNLLLHGTLLKPKTM